MQWDKGFSARYYAEVIDPKTWRDIKRFEITSGSIDKQPKETLIESADITVKNLEGTGENWIRIWLDARQGRGATAHVALFTGLTAAPERKLNGNRSEFGLECYSVLKPANEVLLERGWYANITISGADIVKRLLSVTPAPVRVEGTSPKLSKHIISENGETRLTMARKILEAINWTIQITGMGEIIIKERSDKITATYSKDMDMIEPNLTDRKDWYSCPNVFRAVSGTSIAIARDDDPDNFLSIPVRGREIWKEETDCKLTDGELLAAYAQRRLKEEQSLSRNLKYKRRFDSNVTPDDIVKIIYPNQKINGCFRVISQKITLGHRCKTEEEATEIEQLNKGA